MKFFLIRLEVALKILFRPKLGWVVFYLDRENLIKQLQREDYRTELSIHKLQMHNVRDAIEPLFRGWDREEAWKEFYQTAKALDKVSKSADPEVPVKVDLQTQLERAIENEDYELAAKLRKKLQGK